MPDQNIDQLHGIDLYNCFPKIHHVERRHLCVLPTSQPDIILNPDHSLDLLCVFALRIIMIPIDKLLKKKCHSPEFHQNQNYDIILNQEII